MNKNDFLNRLIGLPREELNKLIKEKGKRPKWTNPIGRPDGYIKK